MFPTLTKPFGLQTDASEMAEGECSLSQEFDDDLVPVADANKKLLPREQREGLAIVWGVRKFQTYLQDLYCREFVLQTDYGLFTFINIISRSTPTAL